MAIDGGTIQSGIRIDLATLKQDVLKVENIYDDLDFNVRKNSKEISKNIKIVENAQKKGAFTQVEAIKRIIAIREKSLKSLKDEIATTGRLTDAQLSEIKKQETELSKLKKTQDSYNKSLKDSDPAIKKNSNSLKSLALEVGAVTLAVTTAKKAFNIFVDTEQALANVKAVTNATEDEFKKLEDAALDAGASTRFTALESADALYSLSSAGLDASEAVSALNGVLLLAGATGSDLAFTSQTLTATLSQFKLEAEDSGKVSNTLAAAIGNSQANIEKLSSAFRQAGPVAGQFGISLEETTASLQALFNAGFRGEQAGTALRNILLTLSDSTSKVNKAYIETGGSLDDVNPRIVGLTTAIENLSQSGIDLSQVFDKEAVPAALTLSDAAISTSENLRDLEQAVTGTNAAAEQYAIQNDTVAGSLDALKSAAESTSSSFIEQLAPIFRFFVDLLADSLRLLNKLPDLVKSLGAGAGSAALGVGVLTKAAGILGITLGSGPLGIVALIGGVVTGLVTLVKIADNKAFEKLNQQFGEIAESLGYTGKALDDFIRKTADIEQNLELFGVADNFESIKTAVEVTAEDLKVSKEEVIAIGKASKVLSNEYKAQLNSLQSQIVEQRIINDLSDTQVLINEKITAAKIRQKRESEEQKLTQERIAKAEKERLERLENITSQVTILDELSSRGAISELDLLEQKKKLREEEVSILIEQSVASGKTTDQVVSDIKKQEGIIAIYNSRIKELTETQKENTEKEEENSNKKIKINEDYINKVNELTLSSLQLLNIAEQKELENAEKVGADTTKIKEFYSLKRQEIIKKEIESEIKKRRELKDKQIDLVNEYTGYIESATGFISNAITGSIDELIDGVSDAIIQIGEQTGSIEAVAAGIALKMIKSISDTFTDEGVKDWEKVLVAVMTIVGGAGGGALASEILKAVRGSNEEIKNLITKSENELRSIILDNRKATIEQALELETERIEEQYNAEIEKVKQTLSEEEILRLQALGILEESQAESLERQRLEQIQSVKDRIAEELGLEKDLTEEQKKIIDSKASKEIEAIEKINAAQQNALQERESAEKEYNKAIQQYNYDKAVYERDLAISTAKANKQVALSEIPWYQSGFFGNTDDKVERLFDNIITSLESSPLPPQPALANGGIVFPSNGGSSVIMAEAGVPEVAIPVGTPGEAIIGQLAEMINSKNTGGYFTLILETDGRQEAQRVVNYINNGQVRLKIK
jgi:TP901 family phage tail tape measure protein